MSSKKYLLQLHVLFHELERAASADPYDPDVYNKIVDRCSALMSAEDRRRRRHPWLILSFLFLLFAILALIIGIVFW